MKECKICRTKAVVNSETIPGLCCCRMCGKFFLEGLAIDCTLSISQILREEIKLSGYKDTILTHDSINVAAQLRHISATLYNAFSLVLDSCSHEISDLMHLSQNTFDEVIRQDLCKRIEANTGLNSTIASFILHTYAYALNLITSPTEYKNNDDLINPLKVNSFYSNKNNIKLGESAELYWNVNHKDAIVAISDGFHQWHVPAIGSMKIKPSKDKTYTLTAVKVGYTVTPEAVKIHLVKPVNITSFKVSKQNIYEGQSVNVSWKVSSATHIKILVNDGHNYRNIEDVTSLRSKEIRLSKDSKIILTCYNECYQAQQILNVQVQKAPRFPIHELACFEQLPKINIDGPALPTLCGGNRGFIKRFERLQKSERSMYTYMMRRLNSKLKDIWRNQWAIL